MANKKDIKWLEKVTKFLDSEFRIPGTDVRIGMDPIIGLFPIVGDLVSYAISTLLVFYMIKNEASGKLVFKMLGNLIFDLIISGIPFAGQIADFMFKANQRNLRLYKEYLNEGKHEGSATVYVVLIVLLLIAIPVFFMTLVYISFSGLYTWMFT